jgi:hypothetical protein
MRFRKALTIPFRSYSSYTITFGKNYLLEYTPKTVQKSLMLGLRYGLGVGIGLRECGLRGTLLRRRSLRIQRRCLISGTGRLSRLPSSHAGSSSAVQLA